MPELFLIGSKDRVEELEADENPADVFPCMSTHIIHAEARAHLYSLLTHEFLDDAMGFESLFKSLTESGPNIYAMEASLMARLAALDENEIEQLVSYWQSCGPVEDLQLDESDLSEFLFQMIHFCQTAVQGEELGIYIYSDG